MVVNKKIDYGQRTSKKILPIIQAFAEDKKIQAYNPLTKEWYDKYESIDFNSESQKYRIKPETKYRPFKDAEECFEEMKKHQPFGWIKDKLHQYFNMISICINAATAFQYDEVEYYNYQKLINEYTFADGTPFGIKE